MGEEITELIAKIRSGSDTVACSYCGYEVGVDAAYWAVRTDEVGALPLHMSCAIAINKEFENGWPWSEEVSAWLTREHIPVVPVRLA